MKLLLCVHARYCLHLAAKEEGESPNPLAEAWYFALGTVLSLPLLQPPLPERGVCRGGCGWMALSRL